MDGGRYLWGEDVDGMTGRKAVEMTAVDICRRELFVGGDVVGITGRKIVDMTAVAGGCSKNDWKGRMRV